MDRPERDVGLEPGDAVVPDEPAVPPERDHLRQAPARARSAPVPAAFDAAVHGRRSRGLVARGRALHGLRSGDLLLRAADPPAGAGARVADAPQRIPPGPERSDRDRHPAVEDRDLPRLPHEPRPGRPREAQARRGLVRHDQVAGARGQAGEPGDPARDGLVVGLGRVGRGRPRPRQAGRRVRLPVDPQPEPVRRSEHGRPQVRPFPDRGPAPPARRDAMHRARRPDQHVPALEHRARHPRPRDRLHVALREPRAQERGEGEAAGAPCGRARDRPLPLRRQRRGVSGRPRPSRRLSVDRPWGDRRRAAPGARGAELPRQVTERRTDRELPRELLRDRCSPRSGDARSVMARSQRAAAWRSMAWLPRPSSASPAATG